MRRPRSRRAAWAVLLACVALPATARAADAPSEEALLAAPDRAPDAGALRIAAEEALERDVDDARAWTALLLATIRLGDADRLEDVVARARPRLEHADAAARGALGAALLRLARRSDPADPRLLGEAAVALARAEGEGGDPRRALDLAHARHLLGESAGAARAYERALHGDEATADLGLRGLASLAGGTDAALGPVLEDLGARRPQDPVVLRWRAELLDRTRGRAAALQLLEERRAVVASSAPTMLRLATWLREADRHAEALPLERAALEREGDDPRVHATIEALWREARPLASFADVAALDRDATRLFARADGDPMARVTYRNDVAFRLREVVARWAARGDARTQVLAEGAPAPARAVLDRVVALYEEAVARIPSDAADRPFGERWIYASVLNDAALMRHYWLDVRDLDRAEALYLRAFELTDGAYQDTYFYNLQYLYGVEKPGQEERWWRLARKAAERILRETPEGGFAPDEAKREAARRDAEALRRLLEASGR